MPANTTNPLGDLERELLAAGEMNFAQMINAAIASEEGHEAFLRSNELWGGAGSIADQAGCGRERAVRRRIEAVLIRLGREQMRIGIANPRTESWVQVFDAWQAQGV